MAVLIAFVSEMCEIGFGVRSSASTGTSGHDHTEPSYASTSLQLPLNVDDDRQVYNLTTLVDPTSHWRREQLRSGSSTSDSKYSGLTE